MGSDGANIIANAVVFIGSWVLKELLLLPETRSIGISIAKDKL